MFKHGIKHLSIAVFAVTISLLSTVAQASLDGNFSGTVPMDMACGAPTVGPINFSATMTIQSTANSVSLNVVEPAGDFNFSGTGTAVDLGGGQFSITTNGSTLINTGNTSIDGTYSPAPFAVLVQLTGTQLSVISGGGSVSGGTPCASLGYGLTGTATLNSTGDNLVVNPEETPGTVLTTPQLFNTQLASIVSDIAARANSAMRGFASGFRTTANGLMFQYNDGLNAGDEAMPFGAWVSYSYNDFENTFAPTAFDGSRHGVLAGIDFMPWEKILLGVTAGFETNNIDTTFNGGEQDTDGFTVAGYFGALLSDTFSVDGSFGYSGMDTDQFRTAAATRITSSTDADRYFMTFNLNGIWFVDNWVLGARTGFLFARNNEDGFTESDSTVVAKSNTKLNQWNAGGDVAYSYGEWEPFARLSYQNDYSQTEIGIVGATQPSFDNDDFLLGFGVRYFSAQGITGNLEYNKRLGRDNFDEDSISFTIRGEF